MATRLLIDAAHPEETRVVVVSGTRLDEFDFESSTKKQLKGNIYLAKVMRVEPSLQAAFVDYGGNRHGFLAFGDIHPDYYQIPVADRQALLKERAAEDAARELAEDEAAEADARTDEAPTESPSAEVSSPHDADGRDDEGEATAEAAAEPAEQPEQVGGDEFEEAYRPRREVRRYKIQEVIKRRQILLVQVVKEERGTKGAALTTYLSLAGRYCVLMPNTARGGGVSRKISATSDRKRLRGIIDSLEVPEGVGLIVRTAGQERTKADIRRDYEYLLRVWDEVRELTLASKAPAMVYEEANLIKRAIRDLYSSNITEVLIEGEEGYKAAKGIMKMLMPSHAKRVQRYDDRIPLFLRYQVEQQLDLMHNPTVQLRSGGYIVLNATEALVAIDVNSGRSTRERNIEETALKTNIEAAEEVARQLRLRDLAGLVVIDFIDMDVAKNNRTVERKLKDSLKGDRARIQVGRISPFGLLELSRQRLRPSLLETSTETCPTCGGTGLVRSTVSAALHVMRVIEDEGIRGGAALTLDVPTAVAIYLLNKKRASISELEQTFGLSVTLLPDPDLVPPAHRLVREDKPLPDAGTAAPFPALSPAEAPAVIEEEKPEDEGDQAEAATAAPGKAPSVAHAPDRDGEAKPAKRRRRGKRGGRRRRRKEEATAAEPVLQADDKAVAEPEAAAAASEAAPEATPEARTEPRRPREKMTPGRSRARKPSGGEAVKAEAEAAAEQTTDPDAGESADKDAPAEAPRRRRSRRRKPDGAAAEPAPSAEAASGPAAREPEPGRGEDSAPPPSAIGKPRRKGWWQRAAGG